MRGAIPEDLHISGSKYKDEEENNWDQFNDIDHNDSKDKIVVPGWKKYNGQDRMSNKWKYQKNGGVEQSSSL